MRTFTRTMKVVKTMQICLLPEAILQARCMETSKEATPTRRVSLLLTTFMRETKITRVVALRLNGLLMESVRLASALYATMLFVLEEMQLLMAFMKLRVLFQMGMYQRELQLCPTCARCSCARSSVVQPRSMGGKS